MPDLLRTTEDGSRQPERCRRLLVLVARYRDLDLESAARLHGVSSRIARHLTTHSAAVSSSVALSTCNRFEIYCEAEADADIEAACSDALAAVSHCSGLSLAELTPLFERIRGRSVAEHLFGVGTGLQSIVVGEREIAGQVRRALSDAQRAGTVSGLLVRLFEAASRTAKEVGARTTISDSSRSIAAVALDVATDAPGLPPLAHAVVILVGTGAYATCVLNILRSRGCSDIAVFSRSGRAEAFVAAKGATALTPETLPAAVARADILIGCSGTGARIGASDLTSGEQESRRPLTVIDLVPSHDFDPSVEHLANVALITLESVREAAPEADTKALRRAREIVQQAVDRFEEQERARAADHAVVALRRHIDGILDQEMARVMHQHRSSASAEEVNAALRRMARQLLHVPTVRARQLAVAGRQDDYTTALEALFGIDVAPLTYEGHHDADGMDGRKPTRRS